MQSYKRKITYFYEHHKENIGTTAGFLKLEIRGDKVKIIINIQEPMGLPYDGAELYFYHEAGENLAAVRVGRLESLNGMLTYQNRTDWQDMYGMGRDLYTFDGVAVVYNENHYYIGDFKDKNRSGYPLVLKKEEKERERSEGSGGMDERKPGIPINEDQPDGGITKRQSKVTTNQMYRPGSRMRRQADGRETDLSDILKKHRPEMAMETAQSLAEKMPQQDQDWYENIPSPKDILQEERSEMPEQPETDFDSLWEDDTPHKQDLKENMSDSSPAGEKQETSEPEKNVYDKCENCPYHKKRMAQQESRNAFEKMIEEYPKLPMYGATELFDCVRIHPRDIGKLDMRNWKLGVNSFLTHGFYTYQYLLLGKMRFDNGKECAIIGVPGVFSNRDKYLANMFGFETFIPVKKTGTKTGEFGYWIIEIQ